MIELIVGLSWFVCLGGGTCTTRTNRRTWVLSVLFGLMKRFVVLILDAVLYPIDNYPHVYFLKSKVLI